MRVPDPIRPQKILDLPRFAEPETQREHFARLRDELLSLMGPDACADYFRALDVEREVQLEPRLPDIQRPKLTRSKPGRR